MPLSLPLQNLQLIASHLSYKPRPDLKIYKANQLESTFVEIINPKKVILSLVVFGVPQGSILGPLLFLIYIIDLNQVLKFCKVHHVADGTNLLHFTKSAYRLNKYINLDLKSLTYWSNANKISLNVKKMSFSKH